MALFIGNVIRVYCSFQLATCHFLVYQDHDILNCFSTPKQYCNIIENLHNLYMTSIYNVYIIDLERSRRARKLNVISLIQLIISVIRIKPFRVPMIKQKRKCNIVSYRLPIMIIVCMSRPMDIRQLQASILNTPMQKTFKKIV